MLLTTSSRLPAVATLDSSCGHVLDTLRMAMSAYLVVAVVDSSGNLVCSSAAQPLPADTLMRLGRTVNSAPGFVVGPFLPAFGAAGPALTLGWVWPSGGGKSGGAIVAGLSLGWLQQRLYQPLQRSDTAVLVADQEGTILAGLGPNTPRAGQALPPVWQSVLGQQTAGVLLRDAGDGQPSVMSYLPAAEPTFGLFVATSFGMTDLGMILDGIAARGYVLLSIASLLSLFLALLGLQRYVRSPVAVLLGAARRLGDGDLNARAHMPRDASSEFKGLCLAFNRMADTLKRQRAELQEMNEALEARVAERTGALLESNNRLQVEIAEREMTEANLRQAQKLQAVGQLAAGIAHNFNNLLSAMLGSLELLQKRLPESGSDTELGHSRLLEIARAAVARGSWLTSQLLAFSRKQPLLAKPVDLAEAIEGMQTLLESTLGSEMHVLADVAPDVWPAMVDPHQFEVAILNLALNAREAMRKNGELIISATNVTVSAATPRSDLATGDYVQVDVADQGLGMPPDVLVRAFEPFFTTKGAGEGAGLGLSQVHGMVTQLGGAVTIESAVGEGTRVSMLLPRSQVRAQRPPDDRRASGGAVLHPDRLVLLVDDDDEVREVTAGILEDCGYTVIAVPNGPAALQAVDRERGRIALVIADYAMPGMTGRELLTIIRRRFPAMPLLLATGYADSLSLAGDGLAVDQILRKPFRGAELLSRIEMVIDQQAILAG